ncbi:MAG: hypothetical protein HUU15_16050 [Candidatus Brocadiae bacterium]|nr:hypothetical protein [Candidatus Brocadiia bacterium]
MTGAEGEAKPRGGMPKGLAVFVSCAVALWCAHVMREVQFATPWLVSRDGYYHVQYAHQLPERGLSRTFEAMQHSFWKDHFSDKEFLFHVWLAPWVRDEGTMIRQAKFATWLLGLAVLAAFGLALRATGVRAPPLWVLVLAGAGNHFLFRLAECRAHVLSIGLFIAGVALLLRGRWVLVGALGFIYSWSYAAPHLLVGIACVHAVALLLWDRKFEWRGAAAAAAGVFAGLLLHPYTPNSLHLWWVQNVVVLRQAWGLGGDIGLHLGEEFGSILPRSLVMSSTAVFASLLLGVLFTVLAARAGRLSTRSFALFLIAGTCLVLYALSARFIEYLAPAAVWFAASVAGDLVDRERLAAWWKERPGALTFAALASALLLVALQLRSLEQATAETRRTRGPVMAGAAKWVRASVPPGTNVAHLNWGDFVQLYGFDPTHRYINGLDPAFMYVRDRSRVEYWENVRTGRIPLDAAEFADVFDADVLIATKEVPRQIRICENALLDVLFEDEGAVVYRLR